MNNDNHTSQQLSHETAAAGRKPTITIYSSIDNLGTAVEQASLDGVKVLTIIPDIDPASNQIQSMDDKTTQALSSAEILVTEPKLLKQLLEWDKDRGDNKLLSRLKWCQCTFAGVDALYPLKTTPSFQLTRFSGPFGPIMAEWCIGRIIAHERNFGASWKDQQDRRWPTIESPVFSYRYLHELTVVILGCGGTIGRHIGRVTKAMGMRTVGFVRSSRTTQQRDDADSVRDELTTNLEQALAHSDYIISVLPSTPETKGLLTLDILQRANELRSNQSAATDGNDNHQPPPVLINCGRGDLISSDTLLEALDKRFLNAAILDVTEEEPLSANSRLWDDPRITISPHVSGLTKADDVPKLLMQNYDRFVNQLPLLHSVRWETLTTEYYQQASSPGSDRSASEALISPSVTANSEPHDEILRIPSDISHDSLSNNLHSNKHILLGVTGSVAAVKAPEIAVQLRQETNAHIKILLTTGAQNFWGQSEEYNPQMWNALQTELSNGNVKLLRSEDEWRTWNRMGDPVMHIDLRDWADCLVVAPLSAHSLAKFAHGLCDDALSSVARAWDYSNCNVKPMILAPAMNTNMWEHPLTQQQLSTVQSFFGREGAKKCHVVSPQVKTLACGQVGNGALAPVKDIVDSVKNSLLTSKKGDSIE